VHVYAHKSKWNEIHLDLVIIISALIGNQHGAKTKQFINVNDGET